MLPIKSTPGAMIFYRAGTEAIKPLETNGNLPIGLEMLQALQTQIIRTFYVEWMLMPSSPDDPAAAGKGVTATYVLQQRDEKMRLLSPMLARLQSEFLGPLIDRTFAIMWRQSVMRGFGPGSPFPPPPPEISASPFHVEYISPIAVAQKSSQLDTLARLVQTQLQLIQADPTTPKVLDGEAILRITARDLNAPSMALKTPDQVKAQQQAEQEAQQQLNGHAALANIAGAMRDGGAGVASLAQASQPQRLAA
jgi:hypothetical protein